MTGIASSIKLVRERDRIVRMIESPESVIDHNSPPAPKKRRGRKLIHAAGRLEVSERLKNYGAGRRGRHLWPPAQPGKAPTA